MKYCECENVSIPTRDVEKPEGWMSPEGWLIHPDCGLPIACEFSSDENGGDHPATTIHVDYVVCDKHLDNAVWNVHDRDA